MKYYSYIRDDRYCLQISDPFAQQCVALFKNYSAEAKERYGFKVNLKTIQASKVHLLATDYGTTIQELLAREPICIDMAAYLDHETAFGTNRELLERIASLPDDKKSKIIKLANLLKHPHFDLCQKKDSDILSRVLVAYVAKGEPAPQTDRQKEFVSSINKNDQLMPPYDVRTVFDLQDLCDVPGKWLMCVPEDVSIYGYPCEAESILAQIKMLPTDYCNLVTNILVGGDYDGI